MSHTSIQLTQEPLGNIYSRRLLLHTPLYQQPPLTAEGPPPAMTMATILSHAEGPPPAMTMATILSHDTSGAYPGDNSFNENVVMVLSVLLCVLMCSLGLNSIIRCALRCLNLVPSEPTHSETIPSSASATKVNTGIKKKVLKTFPTIQYLEGLKQPGLGTDCVICLAEFVPGERLRLLPKCSHGFHVRCIDRWLHSHSSCPTCRHCLVQTCQKIAGGCNSTSSQISQIPSLQQDHMILNIAPLEPEGFIRNY